MNLFNFYLKLGINHILDIGAYDHLLFLAAMVAVYSLKEWKHVIIIATAFTIGHSTTLALAVLNIIDVPTALIEFLIAFTIFFTAITNLFKKGSDYSPKIQTFKYFTAMFFGLIHGLGFSNTLKYLLGEENNIVKPLLAFNIGIEIGQISVISIILVFNFLLITKIKLKQKYWVYFLSSIAIIVSVLLMIQRVGNMFGIPN